MAGQGGTLSGEMKGDDEEEDKNKDIEDDLVRGGVRLDLEELQCGNFSNVQRLINPLWNGMMLILKKEILPHISNSDFFRLVKLLVN